MLPLSPIESIVFFFATLFAVRLLATRLPAAVATYAVGGVTLALFYSGPRLYGRDWYWMGFALGACIGSFWWMAYIRMTETEKKTHRRRETQISLFVTMLLLIALVVMLALGR
jgi:hypothetical protein